MTEQKKTYVVTGLANVTYWAVICADSNEQAVKIFNDAYEETFMSDDDMYFFNKEIVEVLEAE